MVATFSTLVKESCCCGGLRGREKRNGGERTYRLVDCNCEVFASLEVLVKRWGTYEDALG